jgi:DeoR/GlpR family transcriptional regulator of sugar metabolism
MSNTFINPAAQTVLDLLHQKGDSTVKQLMALTGWSEGLINAILSALDDQRRVRQVGRYWRAGS